MKSVMLKSLLGKDVFGSDDVSALPKISSKGLNESQIGSFEDDDVDGPGALTKRSSSGLNSEDGAVETGLTAADAGVGKRGPPDAVTGIGCATQTGGATTGTEGIPDENSASSGKIEEAETAEETTPSGSTGLSNTGVSRAGWKRSSSESPSFGFEESRRTSESSGRSSSSFSGDDGSFSGFLVDFSTSGALSAASLSVLVLTDSRK